MATQPRCYWQVSEEQITCYIQWSVADTFLILYARTLLYNNLKLFLSSMALKQIKPFVTPANFYTVAAHPTFFSSARILLTAETKHLFNIIQGKNSQFFFVCSIYQEMQWGPKHFKWITSRVSVSCWTVCQFKGMSGRRNIKLTAMCIDFLKD